MDVGTADGSDYAPPELHELPPVLALAQSDDRGTGTDDAQTPGKYLKRPGHDDDDDDDDGDDDDGFRTGRQVTFRLPFTRHRRHEG